MYRKTVSYSFFIRAPQEILTLLIENTGTVGFLHNMSPLIIFLMAPGTLCELLLYICNVLSRHTTNRMSIELGFSLDFLIKTLGLLVRLH